MHNIKYIISVNIRITIYRGYVGVKSRNAKTIFQKPCHHVERLGPTIRVVRTPFATMMNMAAVR